MNRLFDMVMAEAFAEEKWREDADKLSSEASKLSRENVSLRKENERLRKEIDDNHKVMEMSSNSIKELTQKLLEAQREKTEIEESYKTFKEKYKDPSQFILNDPEPTDTEPESKDPLDDLIITGDPGKDLDALDKYYIAIGEQHPIGMETRGKIFLMAKEDGLITKDEYMEARSMYGSLWQYSRC